MNASELSYDLTSYVGTVKPSLFTNNRLSTIELFAKACDLNGIKLNSASILTGSLDDFPSAKEYLPEGFDTNDVHGCVVWTDYEDGLNSVQGVLLNTRRIDEGSAAFSTLHEVGHLSQGKEGMFKPRGQMFLWGGHELSMGDYPYPLLPQETDANFRALTSPLFKGYKIQDRDLRKMLRFTVSMGALDFHLFNRSIEV